MNYESGSILAALREARWRRKSKYQRLQPAWRRWSQVRIEKFALIGANWRRWRHRHKGGCLRRRRGGGCGADERESISTRGSLFEDCFSEARLFEASFSEAVYLRPASQRQSI